MILWVLRHRPFDRDRSAWVALGGGYAKKHACFADHDGLDDAPSLQGSKRRTAVENR